MHGAVHNVHANNTTRHDRTPKTNTKGHYMQKFSYRPIALVANVAALSVLVALTSKAQTVVDALQTGYYCSAAN